MSDTTGETPSRPNDSKEDPTATNAPAERSASPSDDAAAADQEETVLVPATADEATTANATMADDADGTEATRVMPSVESDDTAGGTAESRRVTRDELYARADRQGEQERLAAVRAEHQGATTPVAAAPAAPDSSTTTTPAKKLKPPRTTDKFFPSLGLFALRVAAAAVMGVHGVQKLLTMEQTSRFFETLTLFGMPLPQASLLALLTGVGEVLIGVALFVGFLTRIAGFGMLLISVGALLMVKLTTLPNPIAPGSQPGFAGETELLLAGAAVLLLCVGGGSWALDRLFRRGRYSTADDLGE